jgi:superfamily II DNA/RNA helicase
MQNLPTPHQTLLFSATMPAEVEVRSIHWFPYDRVRVVNAVS